MGTISMTNLELAISFRDKFASIPDDAADPYSYLDHGILKLHRRAADCFVGNRSYYEAHAEDFIARDWVPTLLIPGSEYLHKNIYLPAPESEWGQLRTLVCSFDTNPTDITEDKKKKNKMWSGATAMERWRSFIDNIINVLENPPETNQEKKSVTFTFAVKGF